MGDEQIIGDLESPRLCTFIHALLEDLRVLQRLIEHDSLESGVRPVGQEMFRGDKGWRPTQSALEVLEKASDPHFATELGPFNLKANLDPARFVRSRAGRSGGAAGSDSDCRG